MITFTLKRVSMTDEGVFGVLLDPANHPMCVTCEDPDNGNKPNISCIPPGLYQVVPHSGAKFRNVWRLLNVKGREGILIHAGNSIEDTQGCILAGTRFGRYKGKAAAMASQDAIELLRDTFPTQRFYLNIINP